jgi:hypothetical protein
MKRILTVFALFLALSSPARAEFLDGNKLFSICTSGVLADRADCLGYTSGVFDALQSVRWCAPENVTRGQVRDIILQFLTNNPALRSQGSADVLIRSALEPVWPCANRQQPGRQPQGNMERQSPRSGNWS